MTLLLVLVIPVMILEAAPLAQADNDTKFRDPLTIPDNDTKFLEVVEQIRKVSASIGPTKVSPA